MTDTIQDSNFVQDSVTDNAVPAVEQADAIAPDVTGMQAFPPLKPAPADTGAVVMQSPPRQYLAAFAQLIGNFAGLPAMNDVPHIAELRSLTLQQIVEKFESNFAPANIGKHLNPLIQHFGPQATGADGRVDVNQVWLLAAQHAADMAAKIESIGNSQEAQQALFSGFGVTDLKDQAQIANLVGYLAGNPASRELMDKAMQQTVSQGVTPTAPDPAMPVTVTSSMPPQETVEARVEREMAFFVNGLMKTATGRDGAMQTEEIPAVLGQTSNPNLLKNEIVQRFLQQFSEGKTNFQKYDNIEEQRMLLASALMEGHRITAKQAKLILAEITPQQAVTAIGWIMQAPNPKIYHDMRELEHQCSGPECGRCNAPSVQQPATTAATPPAPGNFTLKVPATGIRPEDMQQQKAATHPGPVLVH